MSNPELSTPFQLTVKRVVPAEPAVVFKAWTESEHLMRWFSPSDEMTVPFAKVDPRPGGRYRIAMRPPEADKGDYVMCGEYREIDAPHRLVFTMNWEHHEDLPEDTLVTVQLNAVDGGTEVVLTHERLPNEKMCDEHEKGWIGCLERLSRTF